MGKITGTNDFAYLSRKSYGPGGRKKFKKKSSSRCRYEHIISQLFPDPSKESKNRQKKARKIGKGKKQGNRKEQGLEGQGYYSTTFSPSWKTILPHLDLRCPPRNKAPQKQTRTSPAFSSLHLSFSYGILPNVPHRHKSMRVGVVSKSMSEGPSFRDE